MFHQAENQIINVYVFFLNVNFILFQQLVPTEGRLSPAPGPKLFLFNHEDRTGYRQFSLFTATLIKIWKMWQIF